MAVIDGWSLVKLDYRSGLWRGRLSGPSSGGKMSGIVVQSGDMTVDGVEIRPDGPGGWLVSVPVPAGLLGDGVATFVLLDKAGGTGLASFAIATGELAEDDLRAEVALLRAELDMMKRHFRRLARGD